MMRQLVSSKLRRLFPNTYDWISRTRQGLSMTNSVKKKLSAKQVLSDIRSGMDSAALKSKYRLSDKSLEAVFRKLVEAGALKERERPLPGPVSIAAKRPDAEPISSGWQCPACGRIQKSAVPECPACGVVVAKYVARQEQETSFSNASGLSTLGAVSPGGNGWAAVIASIVVFAIIGGAILIWSGHRSQEETEMAALGVKAQSPRDRQSIMDRTEGSTGDREDTTAENLQEEIEDLPRSGSALSPVIPPPPDLPFEKASPSVEPSPSPVEKGPAQPGSTRYVTGVLRSFHSSDFKREVVEASKTYPVLFQFHSDT